jgi:hypothetical protein
MVRVLAMFAGVFGIPLSFLALLTGIALGLGTRWGVFRYPWVTAKLLLILSVILVGALIIGPALLATLKQGANATPRLIAAAAYDIIALTVATALSVFKPGKRFGSTQNANHPLDVGIADSDRSAVQHRVQVFFLIECHERRQR